MVTNGSDVGTGIASPAGILPKTDERVDVVVVATTLAREGKSLIRTSRLPA